MMQAMDQRSIGEAMDGASGGSERWIRDQYEKRWMVRELQKERRIMQAMDQREIGEATDGASDGSANNRRSDG
jgi:hypothetical protein